VAARGGAVTRLSLATLDGLGPTRAALPPPRSRDDRVGIVHLGIGAFHRAHQAVFTEDAAVATGEDGWGICGVTQRSAAVLEQLRPQDCLYGVLERGVGDPSLRVVGQVREVLFAGDEPELLRSRLADPATRLITLTVTEKGYRRAPGGGLDLDDPAVQADLAGAAHTAIGRLVGGLAARAAGSGAPVSVLSCDNLTDNGHVLRGLVLDFCHALPSAPGDRLASWVEEHVAFPCSMVDRIVPSTTDADRAEAAAILGLGDEALVVAEPFRQWVVQDRFASGRPAWEKAGADLVDDVRPYEALKLRMLNGTHSLLAYLGALRGHDTIAEAVADDELTCAATSYLTEDAAPTLDAPLGLDPAAYGKQVLERFANPALRHRTHQVGMDGSQKLPVRLLPTIAERLAAGAQPRWATLAVAAWMTCLVAGSDARGRALALEDPLSDRLSAAVGGASDPAVVVDRLLGVREVFDEDLESSEVFRAMLTEDVARLAAGHVAR
jgi:fructuronate reductase